MTPDRRDRGRRVGAPLVRDARCFEFLVKYPWGTKAIGGYRRAARHFGWHTFQDPTFEGSDAYRMFVDPRAAKLRSVAAGVRRINQLDDGTLDDYDPVEDWLVQRRDLTWFAADWKHWFAGDDEAALRALGWRRTVEEVGNSYRVTLRVGGRRPAKRTLREPGDGNSVWRRVRNRPSLRGVGPVGARHGW